MAMQTQCITLAGRPDMRYDVLSIDVGITPSAQGVPGAMEHAIPVKPVSRYAAQPPLHLKSAHLCLMYRVHGPCGHAMSTLDLAQYTREDASHLQKQSNHDAACCEMLGILLQAPEPDAASVSSSFALRSRCRCEKLDMQSTCLCSMCR